MSALSDARVSIGKVVAELSQEFPNLTISQIRYYEEQDLLRPERTPAGYRKFSYDDIERLRFILRQARDHFWPLNHIRSVLDQMDRGEVPDTAPNAAPKLRLADDGLPTADTFRDGPSRVRLSRDDVIEQAGISGDQLDELEQHGIIDRRPTQKFYDADDLAIAQMAADFAELGVEPRHLRTIRTGAERQAAFIDQVLAARDDADTAATLAALSVRLQTTLVRRLQRG